MLLSSAIILDIILVSIILISLILYRNIESLDLQFLLSGKFYFGH